MAEILKTVNLWKRFGKVEAVKDVSFSIASGEYVVILGPSGCGKTTLLRLLQGFMSLTGERSTLMVSW